MARLKLMTGTKLVIGPTDTGDVLMPAIRRGAPGASSTVPGPPGPATIAVESTQTLAPGAPASVTNVGTSEDVELRFAIPQGVPGETLPTAPVVDPEKYFYNGEGDWKIPPGHANADNFYYPDSAPYNAVGNGIADDTAELQACIDAAAAAGGGTVIIAKRYGFTGDLYLRGGVCVLQLATPQIETPPEAEIGLVALGPTARVCWGQFGSGQNPNSRNDNPGLIINLLVDGNNIGGASELFRAEGANSTAYNLSIKRSVGNGMHLGSSQNLVFYNLQISECLEGDALVLKPYIASAQGPGGNKFYGGHIGDSKVCLRVTNFGTGDFFPPHDNIFDGVLFETGRTAGKDIDANVILESGETVFRSCVFTIGANVAAINQECNLLITNTIFTTYATVAVLDSCYLGGGSGSDKATHNIRMKSGAGAVLNEVRLYGRTTAANATAVICTDGSDGTGGIDGPVYLSTATYTAGVVTAINGGTVLGIMTKRHTPLRFEQGAGLANPVQLRRAGDTNNRYQQDIDGGMRWLDPVTGATRASAIVTAAGMSISGPTIVELASFTTAARPSAATYARRWIFDSDLGVPLFSNGVTWLEGGGGGGGGSAAMEEFTTAARPSAATYARRWIFDSDLDAPIYSDGTAWVEGQGPKGEKGDTGPVGPIGGQVELDLPAGPYAMNAGSATDFSLTLNGDVDASVSALGKGAEIGVTVVQDATGGWEFNLPSTWFGVTDAQAILDANQLPATFVKLGIWRESIGVGVKVLMTGDLPPGAWSPGSATGKIARYSLDTLGGEDGDEIATIPDPWNANNLTLTTGTVTLEVENGTKFARFGGAASMDVDLSADYDDPVMVAMVVRVNHATTGTIFDGAGVNNIDLATNGSGDLVLAGQTTTLDPGTDWVTIVGIVNGASSKLRLDGVEQSVVVATIRNLQTLRLARNNLGGDFGSVDFADFSLYSSTADLANLETYLNEKRDVLNGV